MSQFTSLDLSRGPALEVDDESGEIDPRCEQNSGWSDTTSLDSSVYKYREQNGRTYHSFKADGKCHGTDCSPSPGPTG
jgi:hypothetical protein